MVPFSVPIVCNIQYDVGLGFRVRGFTNRRKGRHINRFKALPKRGVCLQVFGDRFEPVKQER